MEIVLIVLACSVLAVAFFVAISDPIEEVPHKESAPPKGRIIDQWRDYD